MSNIYLATIAAHGRSAKSKGIIDSGLNGRGERYAINANTTDEAYRKLCLAFEPTDNRPLSGKSYLRKLQVGHTLYVKPGYPVGYLEDGQVNRAHFATVSEIITDNAISVAFKGTCHSFVDFGLSEIATRLM